MKKKRKKKKLSVKEGKPSGVKSRTIKKADSVKRIESQKKTDSLKKVALSILNRQKSNEPVPSETLSNENFLIFQEVKGTLKRIVKKIEEKAKQERIEQSKKDREQKQAEKLEEKKKKDFEREMKKKKREEKEIALKDSEPVLTHRYEVNLSKSFEKNSTLQDVEGFQYDYYLHRKKVKKSKHHCKKHSDGSHCKRKKKRKEHEFRPVQVPHSSEAIEVVYSNNIEIGETVEVSTETGENGSIFPISPSRELSSNEPSEEVQNGSEQKKSEFRFMNEYLRFMTKECQLNQSSSSIISKPEKPPRPTTIVLPQQKKPRKEVKPLKPQASLMKSAQKLLKSLPKHSRRPDSSDSLSSKVWVPSILRKPDIKVNQGELSRVAVKQTTVTEQNGKTESFHSKFQLAAPVTDTQSKEPFPLLKRLVEVKDSCYPPSTISNQRFPISDLQQSQRTFAARSPVQVNTKLIRPPVLQLHVSNTVKLPQSNWMMFNLKSERSDQSGMVNFSRTNTLKAPTTAKGSGSDLAVNSFPGGNLKNAFSVQKQPALPAASLLISNSKKFNTGVPVMMKRDNSRVSVSVVNPSPAKTFVQRATNQSQYLVFPQQSNLQNNANQVHKASGSNEHLMSVIASASSNLHRVPYSNGSSSEFN